MSKRKNKSEAPVLDMDAENHARARRTRKKTRIQQINEQRILDAALDIFSTFGFRGTTVDQVAQAAEMSKPNLLYYFRRKQDMYVAVLDRTLEMWLNPFEDIDENGDPEQEILAYIKRKLEFSKNQPEASRLFMSEILQGAPLLKPLLQTRVKSLVEAKSAVFRKWIGSGKIADIDPTHLVFMIWAVTQHYADFEAQIKAVMDTGEDPAPLFEDAYKTISRVFMQGLLPRS